MAPLLEVDALDVRYGDFQALFGVSLAVDEGDVVAVIGANGAGKSTLMSAIAGVADVAGGDIRFRGTSLLGLSAHRRVALGVSLVPEGRRIFPSLSVEENLLVGAYRNRRGRWTLPAIYEALPLLAPLAKRSAARLSGGEQQALAIGRALMNNPEVLLLDEVSLGLAPIVVKQLYDTIQGIAAQGTTIVVVEQDVTRALAVAKHATCLLEGRVSLAGRPDELGHDAIHEAYFGVAVGEGA